MATVTDVASFSHFMPALRFPDVGRWHTSMAQKEEHFMRMRSQHCATRRALDFATSLAIEDMNGEKISEAQACGARPIRGLLCAARNHGLHAVTLDLGNSGDTAGPRDQVVGYGAFVLE